MFFSQALLWRKGPVANIWTAAYYFKKLKRDQIAQTDIASSVDQIIKDIDISYRILAHLLVGIVRIFSKKVEFLEDDCNKTLKTLTESVEAIYWKNPKKSKHVQKQTSHLAETSDGGTHSGMGLLKALRARSGQVVISVPATFELDLFDLEIADDCDAPDTHQQPAAQANNACDESDCNFFLHESYQRESGCRIFSSTYFSLIEDVIPVEMMIDLDLDITDLYDLTSREREKTALNPDAIASAEQHQESTQKLPTKDRNEEAETVEPSVQCHESPLKDINPDANASAEQHQESTRNVQKLPTKDRNEEAETVEPSAQCHESPLKDINPDANASAEQHQESTRNVHTEDPNGKAEAVKPSVACHESPLKDINVSSKEKDVPILGNMQIEMPLLITGPGLFSPKPMVRTPVKRETYGKLRKRKISSCCDQRTILSNEVMGKAINDSSDLVYKRRKAPSTCLNVWRGERFDLLDQLFSEPLIPCKFLKVLAGGSGYTTRVPNNCNSQLEKPLNTPCENFTDINNTGDTDLEQSTTQHIESEMQESETIEKSVDISDKGTSRFERIRRRLFEPGTPENGPHGRSTDSSDWVHERSGGLSGFGSLPDGPTPRILTETSDTTPSSFDSELGSHDGDGVVDQTKEGSVWSPCTRYVAHQLHQHASDLKRRNQESYLSLEQMLQGKKRKTSARFFYETLMLKGREMIDLKQESPYGDIRIFATPRLDEELILS